MLDESEVGSFDQVLLGLGSSEKGNLFGMFEETSVGEAVGTFERSGSCSVTTEGRSCEFDCAFVKREFSFKFPDELRNRW